PRRNFLHLAAGVAALPVVSRFAWAQAYPSRPVRIVVGFPAGGSASDIVARLIGPMAVGAALPDRFRLGPARRRNQYSHRGSRARATGRLHAPLCHIDERAQRDNL